MHIECETLLRGEYVSALHRHVQEAFLVSSERCSIEEQSIEKKIQ
jgi:hypothetical protein